MWLICGVLLGALVGWIAGRMAKGRGVGGGVGIVAGIAVLVFGGVVLVFLGFGTYGWIAGRVMSAVGDVLLLIIHLLQRV